MHIRAQGNNVFSPIGMLLQKPHFPGVEQFPIPFLLTSPGTFVFYDPPFLRPLSQPRPWFQMLVCIFSPPGPPRTASLFFFWLFSPDTCFSFFSPPRAPKTFLSHGAFLGPRIGFFEPPPHPHRFFLNHHSVLLLSDPVGLRPPIRACPPFLQIRRWFPTPLPLLSPPFFF